MNCHALERIAMSIRFLRFSEVQAKIGLSRSSLWRMERANLFPKRKRLGQNSVGWLESEIDEWIATRAVGLK